MRLRRAGKWTSVSPWVEAYILGTLFHYIVKKDQAVEAFRKRQDGTDCSNEPHVESAWNSALETRM